MPSASSGTARTYWNSHSLSQILGRFQDGFRDMALRSFTAYAFWRYLLLYVGFAVALIATNGHAAVDLIRHRAGVVWFLGLYAALYLAGTAFFVTISGTGSMRFLLAHAAPLFFVLSYLLSQPPFSQTTWVVGRWRVTLRIGVRTFGNPSVTPRRRTCSRVPGRD
jgi:hypothetical protein